MQFRDIIGQEESIKSLLSEYHKGRIPNAKLFLGSCGRGGLSMAMAYAQLINCSDPLPTDSCGECPSCKKSVKLAHPDIFYSYPVFDRGTSRHDDLVMEDGPWTGKKYYSSDFILEWREKCFESAYFNFSDWQQHIASANKQLAIPVWESRKIVRTISLTKVMDAYRIFIIWMPENFNLPAANSLLKVIEEPPKGNIFLFVSEQYDAILPTISSRLQLVRMQPIAEEVLQKVLVEQYGKDPLEASQIAAEANGDLRNCLEFDLRHHNEMIARFKQWVGALNSETLAFDGWLNDISRESREMQKAFIGFSLSLFQRAYWVSESLPFVAGLKGELAEYSTKLSSFINPTSLDSLYSEFNTALTHLERNANSRLLFHDLSMKLYASLLSE